MQSCSTLQVLCKFISLYLSTWLNLMTRVTQNSVSTIKCYHVFLKISLYERLSEDI